ncbi:unnamed protein product [Mytilus coruscus]|uniref:Uncharacterized protein n=1 Tax=Mytilus coruscus TaxID=42192 RepID=A0A6J8BAI2_MYTCO|nr:unnamed protein product [Mytilus coruscus]
MSDPKEEEISLQDNISASGDLADELHVYHAVDIAEASGCQSNVQSENSLSEKHKKKKKRPNHAKRDFSSDSSESESDDYSKRRKKSKATKINNQDLKTARLLLRDKQECLAKNDKHLFGSEFKEELKEWSKTKKEASEMTLALGGGKTKSRTRRRWSTMTHLLSLKVNDRNKRNRIKTNCPSVKASESFTGSKKIRRQRQLPWKWFQRGNKRG